MRLPDNMCILEDSEQILIEKEKFYELYLLYKNRGHHRKGCFSWMYTAEIYLFSENFWFLWWFYESAFLV